MPSLPQAKNCRRPVLPGLGVGARAGLPAGLTSIQGGPGLVMLVLPWAAQKFQEHQKWDQIKGPSTSPPLPSMAGGAAPAWTHAPPLSDPQHFPTPSRAPSLSLLLVPSLPGPLLACLLGSLLTSTPLCPQPLLLPGSDVPPAHQAWVWAPPLHEGLPGLCLFPGQTQSWGLTAVWPLCSPPVSHLAAGGMYWGPEIGKL